MFHTLTCMWGVPTHRVCTCLQLAETRRKHWTLSELGLQEVVSHPIWVLRTEPLSSKSFMCS